MKVCFESPIWRGKNSSLTTPASGAHVLCPQSVLEVSISCPVLFPSCNAQVAVSSRSCVQCHALFPFGHCDCVVLGGGLPFLVLDHNTVLVPLPCWLNIFCFLEWLFSMHSLNVSSLMIHSLVSFPTVGITSVVSSAFQVFAGLQKCLPNPIMFIDL